MNKEYWDGVEFSLKNQRKYFLKSIEAIDENLKKIEALRKMEVFDENSVVRG